MVFPDQLSLDSQSVLSKKRRNREMCHRCRHDKQKCEPQGRNWDTQEKCRRCRILGYECGPSERAPKKQKQAKQSTEQSHKAGLAPPASRSDGQHEQHEQHAVHDRPALRIPNSIPTPQRSRPMTSFGVEAEKCTADPELQSSIPKGHNTYDACSSSESDRSRRLLVKLGDQIATVEILTSELETWTHVVSWTGSSLGLGHLQASIQAGLEGVKKLVDSCLKTAQSLAEDLEHGREAFLLHILRLTQKFETLSRSACICFSSPQYASGASVAVGAGRIEQLLHEFQRNQGSCSEALYLCSRLRQTLTGAPSRHAEASAAQLATACSRATDAIIRVLNDIVFEDFQKQQTLLGPWPGSKLPMSACHLAARQWNPLVIHELWERSKQQPTLWERDMFGRSPVHIAAYTGNIQALEQVFDATSASMTRPGSPTFTYLSCPAVMNTEPDAFGMTPLTITACRDDLEGFQILRKYGADTEVRHSGRNVWDMAMQNNSRQVMRYITSSNFAALSSPPILASRQEALENLQTLSYKCGGVPDDPYEQSSQAQSSQSFDYLAEFSPFSAGFPSLQDGQNLTLSLLEPSMSSSDSRTWLPGQQFYGSDDLG